jgi:broad specificity phosphatase PhoE
MMTRTWYFARHCQSLANRDKLLTGQLDSPLSWYGYWQCLGLLGRSRRLHVSRVLTSDLLRARTTAQFLCFGSTAELIVAAELRERSAGIFQGWSKKQLKQSGLLSKLSSWRFFPPGGESRLNAALRVVGWLQRLPDSETTLVVSHQSILSILIGLLDNRSGKSDVTRPIGNGDFIIRTIQPDFWMSLHSHLSSAGSASEICEPRVPSLRDEFSYLPCVLDSRLEVGLSVSAARDLNTRSN